MFKYNKMECTSCKTCKKSCTQPNHSPECPKAPKNKKHGFKHQKPYEHFPLPLKHYPPNARQISSQHQYN